MQHNGKTVDCYGEAYPGQNYALTFDDESLDFIRCTCEETGWNKVLTWLKEYLGPDFQQLEQVEAV